MNNYKEKFFRTHLGISIISVFLSFILATIIMIITGLNPLSFYKSILRTVLGIDFKFLGESNFFNPRYIGEFIQISMPITLAGLSVGFAFKTGLFNIGAEGQLIMGSLGAVIVGVLFELPMFLHLPLAIIVAGLFGAIWGIIPGYLKARYGVHEVVITIMMNYAALYLSAYILKLLPGSDNQKTVKIAGTALLQSDFLKSITSNSRLHWGFIIVILSVLLYKFIIDKTVFGYELKSVGLNKDCSSYSGMKVNSRIIYSMAIAGFFAGLAGSMLSVGTFDYGRVIMSFENYGFDGLSVALLGASTSAGIFISGLLFGALKSSQTLMQASGIPLEMTIIVSALIIMFVAMNYGILKLIDWFYEKKGGKNEIN